ncbi:hypothetical protein DICVIV_05593 [Dictyocaulus viviparus]|uniref:Uncharacterized protein n=1 Tax=Dictyocaulus viviparus TaxID=29172 RepID=A0A0D8XWZ5_DICVI|nr:hypothetical protein DICVIV_05593 [Dictyocaulus viviparus]
MNRISFHKNFYGRKDVYGEHNSCSDERCESFMSDEASSTIFTGKIFRHPLYNGDLHEKCRTHGSTLINFASVHLQVIFKMIITFCEDSSLYLNKKTVDELRLSNNIYLTKFIVSDKSPSTKSKQWTSKRDLNKSLWDYPYTIMRQIFGMCNNFAYNVMLGAAQDILRRSSNITGKEVNTSEHCVGLMRQRGDAALIRYTGLDTQTSTKLAIF